MTLKIIYFFYSRDRNKVPCTVDSPTESVYTTKGVLQNFLEMNKKNHNELTLWFLYI